MNKLLIVLVLVLVLGGGWYMMKGNTDSVPVQTTETNTEASGAAMEKGEVKEFTVDSFEMGFSLKTITVKKGDTVKITLTNSGKYTHDWVVDEFKGQTKVIKTGETDTITFVADKVGTFEYYCSVMEHRKMGMVGSLIVEE